MLQHSYYNSLLNLPAVSLLEILDLLLIRHGTNSLLGFSH